MKIFKKKSGRNLAGDLKTALKSLSIAQAGQKLAEDAQATAENTTERNRAVHSRSESALHEAETAQTKAEDANQAKSDFLSNMSHEIRTPMNAVIGLTNILLMTKLDEKQKQYVTVLQSSAQSLMLLINDLLDIDKIESRVIDLEQAPFSMAALLDQIISIMSVKAQEKGIRLNLRYEAGLSRNFIGDSARIRQIVLNLVSNAIKFTQKGEVCITLANGGMDNGKKKFSIAVQDTGIGIPADKIAVIFEKFVQSDSSISRKYGGTGLGLAISRALAEQMGGSIDVTSEADKGSTFTLYLELPLSDANEEKEKPYQENIIYLDIASNSKELPILLAEDYKANVLVAATMFDNFGYRYEVASNGKDAVDKFSPGKYSVILMDVQMPVMDGHDATRMIRAREKAEGLPHQVIIAVTAHALKGDREMCIKAGMDDYISKPFNPYELQAMLLKYHRKGPAPVALVAV